VTATNADAAPALPRVAALLRVEDLVMIGWVAVVSPVLFRVGGEHAPFQSGQPLLGLLELASVIGVLTCIAARRAPDPGGRAQPGLINRGVIGPQTGGLLLVTVSGFTALGVPSQLVLATLVVAGVTMVVVHLGLPPLDVFARRALVAPFGAVAGGIYWSFIEAVLPNQQAVALRRAAFLDPHAATPVLLFLGAFSVIYYAMLVYAPRQIAEREGGWPAWILRYLAFAASIALGIGWLSMLSA